MDQRAGGVARAGVHDEARRLVDDEHALVLVRDAERDVLGDDRAVRLRGKLDGHALAADEAVARACPVALDGRAAVTDEPLRVRAADVRHTGDRQVEATALGCSLDDAGDGRGLSHVEAWPWRCSLVKKVSTMTRRPIPTTTPESATLNVGQRVVPMPTDSQSVT